MKLSELVDHLEYMGQMHGDHEVFHAEGRRELMPVGEESIYFSENEEAYYF